MATRQSRLHAIFYAIALHPLQVTLTSISDSQRRLLTGSLSRSRHLHSFNAKFLNINLCNDMFIPSPKRKSRWDHSNLEQGISCLISTPSKYGH